MSTKAEADVYFRRVLVSILDFLAASGLAADAIQEMTANWAKSRASNQLRRNIKRAELGADIDTVYASVLHRWHRDVVLLDEDAKPKGLTLYGKSQSVESLVRDERPRVSARRIVASMKNVGLVRKKKNGLFFPASRIATVSKLHPMLVEHVAKSLSRYLDTVRQNISPSRSVPTLIERFTHIPDLPRKELGNFRDFSQRHGSAFLAGVDDWLEPRRARRRGGKSSKGCAAGIHVFAYIEDSKRTGSITPRAKRA